ncbi:site-specific integrase [Ancylobacter sp. WKF20]|uniref:tyrosine-type recombinase/integrase n=1 Tax=Ancylobacter sp. WKF20 TaxID=3039801 RepID=UPI0024341998|nr:site-specific integrase [Ancylobacter sp. WKF20]WGD31253.1 site-specific integrase [Ancylobacter sp. WKF20]
MSLYQPKGSPFYHYDFQVRGRRFHGSTKAKTLKAAKLVEAAEREKAKQIVRESERLRTGPLTMLAATSRYWEEVGKHHAGAATTWTNLQRLFTYFGAETRLADIDDDAVAHMVAWRRGHRAWAGDEAPFISPATVNRSTTEVLKKLFNRAKRAWGAELPREPNWKIHMLREPTERTRELRPAEETRLDAEMRDDLEPFFAFARASGLRLSECFIRWEEVDWEAGVIQTIGKGSLPVRTIITAEIRTILWPLRGHHPHQVFTYVVQRTVRSKGLVKGERLPLTYDGLKSYWRRMKKRAGMADFRFHDFRHDLGTKLLRQTGNLKLVQKALNHRDIKTTVRYAHVLDEDLREGLEKLSKSRNKSRTGKRKLKAV